MTTAALVLSGWGVGLLVGVAVGVIGALADHVGRR